MNASTIRGEEGCYWGVRLGIKYNRNPLYNIR